MDSNFLLALHNIIATISAISILGVAVFTYLNGKRETANIMWALACLATAVFIISHIIGANLADPELSRIVFMFNLSVLFISVFNLHAVLAMVGKEKEKAWFLKAVYVSAFALTALFIFFPNLFLLPSIPKMYFPNYYVPGVLNWTRIAFMYLLITPYITYLLLAKRRSLSSTIEKNQYKYFIVALIVGYTFGFIPNFLVYNIPIDPLWGMSFAILLLLPFAYGAIRYGLMNIQIIAKQAFLYSIAVAIVGMLVTLFNYSNLWIAQTFPFFPVWVTALVSAILVVTVSIIVWRYLKESDILKYEFISTVMHTFRTPLTHIKWSTETLLETDLKPEQRSELEYIRNANTKLVELVNLLVLSSREERGAYIYKLKRENISMIMEKTLDLFAGQIKRKKLNVVRDIEKDIFVLCDITRISFVAHVIIENAVHYTPNGGTLTASVHKQEEGVRCSVTDTGVGMTKEDAARVFLKFYRGEQARHIDTEGMGIGLFLAKEIVQKHNGKMEADSKGLNQGSSFSFVLPKAP